MKVFIAFATVLVAASASQLAVLPVAPVLRAGLLTSFPSRTQYHTQDALGQYRYGYSDELSSKEEIKTFDGITRGSYSYVDANGELQSVDYTADAINGFRVAATNLPKALPAPELAQPKPVEETPEVAEAKAAHFAAHFAAHNEAKTRSSEYRPAQQIYAEQDLPKQVEDTPEVAQAKAEHLAAKKQAELINAAIEDVRTPPAYQPPAYSYLPAIPAASASLPIVRTAYIPHAYSYSYAPLAHSAQFLPHPFLV